MGHRPDPGGCRGGRAIRRRARRFRPEIDVEDPAPGKVLDHVAAQNRAKGGAEDRREHQHAGDANPFLRCKRPVEERHADRCQTAAARALQHAEKHQLFSDWAMPQRADAETKMARAKRKTRLYPKRSPNQPDAGMKTARLTRYPTITPSIEAELTLNWRASVGNATLTTVNRWSSSTSRRCKRRRRRPSGSFWTATTLIPGQKGTIGVPRTGHDTALCRRISAFIEAPATVA